MARHSEAQGKGRPWLGEVFARFAEKAAISVMVRATMENVLAPDWLDELFENTAERQYKRKLLFSTLVGLMAVVVCRVQKSVNAAFKAMREVIPVSLAALYDKLNGTEPGLSSALVRESARRLRAVVEAAGGALAHRFAGYRMKIIDGCHLAATQRRIKPLRRCKAGPLPGFGLAVLDPALMLAIAFLPCEDGHAQERSLTQKILALVEPGDIWLADRNFCSVAILFGIAARDASFIIRQHGSLPWQAVGAPVEVGRTATGRVTEQDVTVPGPEGTSLRLRRITVHLDSYTRDADTELHLLTNLPAKIPATEIADAYRDRWRIEGLFAELERNLNGEIATLDYPKAALFAFAVALVAYNVLSTAKAAMRAQHGAEVIEQRLSAYYVADELSGTQRGMEIAIPEEEWHPFRGFTAAQLATFLVQLAANIDIPRFTKKRCGPRGPRLARLRYAKKQHVSTFRLLAAQPHTRRAP